MNIAIMQPYFLPYIGYFQLINTVNEFVFYDDVSFMKKSFINRNSILLNGKRHQFTIPLKKASQNKLINEVEVAIDKKWLDDFLKTIDYAYKAAPNYQEVKILLDSILSSRYNNIAELAIQSVILVSNYLNIDCKFSVSSERYSETKKLSKAERLIAITKASKKVKYINAINGKLLYDKRQFKNHNIDLYFLESEKISYMQFGNEFVESLSILDVLMFNTKHSVKALLDKNRLI